MKLCILILSYILLNGFVVECENEDIYTGSWVIEVKGDIKSVEIVADDLNLKLLGKAGSLKDLYIVKHKKTKRHRREDDDTNVALKNHRSVLFSQQQKLLKRVKRGYFTDPLFKDEWYIENQDVWKKGITGKGVVVTVVDDGIEYTHPDLKRNYDPKASYDYNSHDSDPIPTYTYDNINKHGTRCAGEIASEAGNKYCGVGIAYNSTIGGIRMLDGDVTDLVEGSSLSHNPDQIDIYSNSWGPDDDGKTVDGPGPLARKAFEQGVEKGRKGLGSIYVWATGNGGKFGDYCSCDGYINRIETIAIGAVDYCGNVPYYAEACPGTLAVTYSSGSNGKKQIATTDLHKRCTKGHTGTSAASPLAAGILALALEANPKITWRDMQHLIVRSSKVIKQTAAIWTTNGAGHKVNSNFGFGVLDAGNLVNMATDKQWKTADKQIIYTSDETVENKPILLNKQFKSSMKISGGCNTNTNTRICKLEHVKVYISLSSARRGGLEITLTSPLGTVSPILQRRLLDTERNFNNWGFLSVYFWDEDPTGIWTLTITNSKGLGSMGKWKLQLYGTNL